MFLRARASRLLSWAEKVLPLFRLLHNFILRWTGSLLAQRVGSCVFGYSAVWDVVGYNVTMTMKALCTSPCSIIQSVLSYKDFDQRFWAPWLRCFECHSAALNSLIAPVCCRFHLRCHQHLQQPVASRPHHLSALRNMP